MSEPENFLTRWSRRKSEAEQKAEPAAAERDRSVDARKGGDEASAEGSQAAARDARLPASEQLKDPGTPAFDVSSLPSLDSITAETDVTVFLQKGVPPELSRAALRRAWAADPGIRDFIGIAENQYDFATGSDLPGFGTLDISSEEIRRLVADIFGESPRPAANKEQPLTSPDKAGPEGGERPATPSQAQDVAGLSQEESHAPDTSGELSASIVQSNTIDIAMQQEPRQDEYESLPARRPHGRALPQ